MIDSIKKGFTLFGKALSVFCVIAGLNVVLNIINLLIIPAPVDAEMTLGRSFLVIGLGVLFFLLAIFVQSGVLVFIKEVIKKGKGSLSSFIDDSRKYFPRMLGLMLLTFLIILGISIPIIGGLPFVPAGLRIITALLFDIVMIGLILLLIMPAYALIGSDLSVMASLKKGVSFGMQNILKIAGILIVMMVIGILVMLLSSLLIGLLSILIRPAARVIAAVIMAIASGALTVLSNIVYMDFYLKKS